MNASRVAAHLIFNICLLLSSSAYSYKQQPTRSLQQITRSSDPLTNQVNNIQNCVNKIKDTVEDIEEDVDAGVRTQDFQDEILEVESSLDELQETSDSILDKVCDILSIVDKIDDTTETIDSKVDVLQSVFERIEEKVCVPCDVIITQEDITEGSTYTISEPGVYCLAENITNLLPNSPVFEIIAPNVVLDLNAHTITTEETGVKVTDAINVVIKNGTIKSGEVGVHIDPSSNVLVQDITVIAELTSNTGFSIDNSTDIVIENCQALDGEIGFFVDQNSTRCVFRNCIANHNIETDGDGFFLVGPSNCCLFDCKAFSNDGDGFIIGGENHLVVDCTAHNNNNTGFVIIASNSTFRNCQATSNSNHGFDLDQNFEEQIIDIICNTFENCIANGNDDNGFKIQGAQHTFKGCISVCNTAEGFHFENDVDDTTSTDHVICDCIAINNRCGFEAEADSARIKFVSNKAQNNTFDGFDNENTTNRYYNNCSCNNGVSNYDGLFERRFVFTDDTTDDVNFWDNMDCRPIPIL